MFRDYLRLEDEACNEDEEVKIAAVEKYRYSPREYVGAKYDCVMSIMKREKVYYKSMNK